jgi:hypothetical protein
MDIKTDLHLREDKKRGELYEENKGKTSTKS